MDTLGLDWLSFTFRLGSLSDVQYCLDWVKFYLDYDLKMSDKGTLRGYRQGGFLLDGTGRFAYDLDRLEQGFHISLPGQSLALLAVRYSNFDFLKFLEDISSVITPCCPGSLNPETGEVTQENGVNFSRVDFALDDKSNILSMQTISDFIWSRFRDGVHCLTTRYKPPKPGGKSKPLEYKSFDGRGHTIYLGSPMSSTRLRIYDKAAEQGLEDTHWLRVEFQARDDKAGELVKEVLKTGLKAVPSVILSYLDFKEFQENFRPQDLNTVSWWSDFLGVSDKIRLSSVAVLKTVEKTIDWVNRQVAPALSLISQAFGDDILSKLVNSGQGRLRQSHRDMLARFREVLNTPQLVKFLEGLGGIEVKPPLFSQDRIFEQREVTRAIFKAMDKQEINIRLGQSSGEYRHYADGKPRIIHNIDGFWALGVV